MLSRAERLEQLVALREQLRCRLVVAERQAQVAAVVESQRHDPLRAQLTGEADRLVEAFSCPDQVAGRVAGGADVRERASPAESVARLVVEHDSSIGE